VATWRASVAKLKTLHRPVRPDISLVRPQKLDLQCARRLITVQRAREFGTKYCDVRLRHLAAIHQRGPGFAFPIVSLCLANNVIQTVL